MVLWRRCAQRVWTCVNEIIMQSVWVTTDVFALDIRIYNQGHSGEPSYLKGQGNVVVNIARVQQALDILVGKAPDPCLFMIQDYFKHWTLQIRCILQETWYQKRSSSLLIGCHNHWISWQEWNMRKLKTKRVYYLRGGGKNQSPLLWKKKKSTKISKKLTHRNNW